MKKHYIFIISIFLFGCNMFDVSDQLLLSHWINKNKIIEVHSVWYGEPRKDATLIEIKKEGERLETIKRIDSNYSSCSVSIIRINDSIFKISLNDTTDFKGKGKFFTVDINKRLN